MPGSLAQANGGSPVDLSEIADKLDRDEKLTVTYRFPVSTNGDTQFETRTGRLLDVAAEAKLLYVSYEGQVIWIKDNEVISLTPEEGA